MAYTEDIHKTGNDLMHSFNRLKWSYTFEATARHGSFTGAAQELGVTPTAVGQLVRALEDWVGHPLLHRARSGKERLTLISEAQDALREIAQGLDSLEFGLNKLRGRRAHSVVTITASQVPVMNRLMSRLNRFSQAHENIESCLNVTEKLMDVIHGETDPGIRCGKGDWPGVNKTWLTDEEAVLVCSPRIVPVDKISCGEWLVAQKLIHDGTPRPGINFPGWNDVLTTTQAPVVRDSGLHINPTSAVISAALSGRGVVIVCRALVQQLLTDGQLVQLHSNTRWPLAWSYYIVTPQHAVMRLEVKVFNGWLIADVLAEIVTISAMTPVHRQSKTTCRGKDEFHQKRDDEHPDCRRIVGKFRRLRAIHHGAKPGVVAVSDHDAPDFYRAHSADALFRSRRQSVLHYQKP